MKKILILVLFSFIQNNVFAILEENSTECVPKVHVWYTLKNLSELPWNIQIAQLYENNISFVDSDCSPLQINKKISLAPQEVKKVGMIVQVRKGFSAIYSFTGVREEVFPETSSKDRMYCLFIIAPYGPKQMNKHSLNINNADCFVTDYGTNFTFK